MKIRYFKTPYVTTTCKKLFLHYNYLGHFANRDAVVARIKEMNGSTVTEVGETKEVVKRTYSKLMKLPDSKLV